MRTKEEDPQDGVFAHALSSLNEKCTIKDAASNELLSGEALSRLVCPTLAITWPQAAWSAWEDCAEAGVLRPGSMPSYWWVNHKQTYRQETNGGYI